METTGVSGRTLAVALLVVWCLTSVASAPPQMETTKLTAGDGDSEGVYLAMFDRQDEVPEPTTMMLLAGGLVGVAAIVSRRKRWQV